MTDPFIGEIRMIGADFAPKDWALCNGQLLSINENQTLYSLLGTTFGGDGRVTFSLPDLRGRAPVHPDTSAGLAQGTRQGAEQVTLNVAEMAAHTHSCNAQSTPTTKRNPDDGAQLAQTNYSLYTTPENLTSMAQSGVTHTGPGQSHYNVQPSSTINYIISLSGLYPSRE